MTPAARDAAAIDILNRWCAGQPLEATLTVWARENRYAGSGDREAVRDTVFRVVRCFRSCAALGGGQSGRALLLGLARGETGGAPDWRGEGYGPPPLSAVEQTMVAAPLPDMTPGAALDCPDWLLPRLKAALGEQADATLRLMRHRAPVFVRVNRARTERAPVIAELAVAGIDARVHPLADTALEITRNPRRLRLSPAYVEGRIELQDAASQAVALAFARQIPAASGVLDYCAGGGGKALALAAEGVHVMAHDADSGRMRDLPIRAARAGATITVLATAPDTPQGAILADVPCSGSGSWRRTPEAKWALTGERLAALIRLQDQILSDCGALVASGGVLGYATCSLLRDENEDRIAVFLARHSGWQVVAQHRWGVLDGGDGFFLSILRRE